ncbi:phosphoglucosamine mutase [Roseimaritima sediminicola]|uniref:phosphoglucosamine mutase n=1 Tax=Roseimaritima sediminicola TaxID=2662066 RepID=UPI00129829DB|nr:phosphoglucosamine mutase [Roseimaritima sediminicola]
MSKLIISVSGLRGIVGETLDPLVVARYAAAFSVHAPAGPIVVARDGRATGPVLRDALTAALRAAGREVIDADVAATPTVGVLVRHLQAAGAVMISASHNPPPYNGMKLFGADGRVLDARQGATVRDTYLAETPAWVPHDGLGSLRREADPHTPHLEKVLATVDGPAIRKRNFRVLLDSNHGAGSLLGKRLLEALGCDVVALGDTPDGLFDHTPEPTAENLREVAAQVREAHCDVGFCQDPDADRLALIDADGRYIGEEFTLALCVQRALEHPETTGPMVINCASSAMSEQLGRQAGVEVYRSAVGEANVADLMIEKDAKYGGEGNGGPIDPRVGYVRDSFVGMAQILDLLQSSDQTLAELADAMPRYAIHKTKATVPSEKLDDVLDAIAGEMTDGHQDRQDGLRVAWDDAWLLVRGSNTEPIVRLIAEAEDVGKAAALCQRASQIVQRVTM